MAPAEYTLTARSLRGRRIRAAPFSFADHGAMLIASNARTSPMIDLYYWPTPNGKKVTILLEECGLPYNIIPLDIGRGDHVKDEFLKLNPNHRRPVMVDREPKDGGAPISIFESGAI